MGVGVDGVVRTVTVVNWSLAGIGTSGGPADITGAGLSGITSG